MDYTSEEDLRKHLNESIGTVVTFYNGVIMRVETNEDTGFFDKDTVKDVVGSGVYYMIRSRGMYKHTFRKQL